MKSVFVRIWLIALIVMAGAVAAVAVKRCVAPTGRREPEPQRISGLVQTVEAGRTPLQENLDRLVKWMECRGSGDLEPDSQTPDVPGYSHVRLRRADHANRWCHLRDGGLQPGICWSAAVRPIGIR